MKAENHTQRRVSLGSKIRVFLVDDHPIVRRGLQSLISFETDLMVCGEAESGPAALQQILAVRPDVAVVDLGLKASSGLDLIKQLHGQVPELKILVFSMRDEGIYAERALRAGAHGYLTKEDGSEKALEAVRQLMRGNHYLSEGVAAKLVDKLAGGGARVESPIELLSDRELEVFVLIGQGRGSRDIAEALRVSIKTVESHREHIKDKLGLSRAAELVNYAFIWLQDQGLA